MEENKGAGGGASPAPQNEPVRGAPINREGLFMEAVLFALRKLQADPAIRVDLEDQIDTIRRLRDGWGLP